MTTMSLSQAASPLSGSARAGAGGPVGLYVAPEPSRGVTALVADLFWPMSVTPAMQHGEVRGRLLGVLRHLLAARRVTVLQWESMPASPHAPASYTVWHVDAAGGLHNTGDALDARAAPLPLVAAQAGGVLIERPWEWERGQIDPSVFQLLGPLPALLASLPGAHGEEDILALSLGAVPRDGETALALAFVQRATTVLSGPPGDHRTFLSGGRVSHGLRAHEDQPPGYLDLSPREREVVQLVAAGLRNKEIALRLQIAEKTVKFHLGHIFDKLGVDSRTEVLLRVLAEGVVAPGYPRRGSANSDAPGR